jgi:hypothetical protein
MREGYNPEEAHKHKKEEGLFAKRKEEGHIFKKLTKKGKKALAVGVALGASAVGYEGVSHKDQIVEKFGQMEARMEEEARESKIEHRGTGIIVEKIDRNSLGETALITGKPGLALFGSEQYMIKIKVGNDLGIAMVSEDDYNKKYKEGQSVEVLYKEGSGSLIEGTRFEMKIIQDGKEAK